MENYVNTPVQTSIVGRFVFLLIAFPLGLLYFLVTVIGLSLGLGTIVIWIGLPILFITLLCIRGMAEIERRIVASLLHVTIPYHLQHLRERDQGFLRQFGRVLRDPYTWMSTIYMVLKLPLGILSFGLTLALVTASACLTCLPLTYLLNTFIDFILLKSGVSHSNSILIPYFIEIHGWFDLVMFARSFVLVPLGIVLWIITRFVLTGLAFFSGELARALLGPGEMIVVQPHQDMPYASPLTMSEQHANVD